MIVAPSLQEQQKMLGRSSSKWKERNKHLQEYRAKKIKLYEKMVAQQGEMLQLQRRSTEAVELIVAKFPGQSLNSPMSPFSVSPIIKFPNLS